MAPLFGALVKVAPSKPANETVCAVPSTASARLPASATTLSVRPIEAPGGSWIAMMR